MTLPLSVLEPFGQDLSRPECVVTSRRGDVFVSDWRGGVTAIHADGTQSRWLAADMPMTLKPNGVTLTSTGSFLVTHLGETGGVWEIATDGTSRPILTEVDGVPLPPTNYATRDRLGRIWVSVSTRHEPRQRAWRPDVADGFIAVVDASGPRIAADGLHYTNEVRPDPSGTWLYVVETFGRRVVRMPIRQDGSLGSPEVVVTLGLGCFPDGFAFDEEDGLWITSLISNRLLRFADDRLETVIEEANPTFVEAAEAAFLGGTMAAEHLGPIPGTRLQHVTSIAFGGPDRRTAYLGTLHGSCIHRFHAPVAGAVPDHWSFDDRP